MLSSEHVYSFNLLVRNMNFVRERGEATVQPYKKDGDVAFAAGDAVMLASGLLVKANASATPSSLVGVIMEDVVSTDDDYSDETFKNVDTGALNDEYRAVVGTGTATAAMVGGRYELDANGQVDVTATTTPVVEVVRFIDASTVIVKFIAS